LVKYWKTARREETADKKSKRKERGKKEGTGEFSSVNLYKMKVMLQEKEENLLSYIIIKTLKLYV
jgi:hypothetical protein